MGPQSHGTKVHTTLPSRRASNRTSPARIFGAVVFWLVFAVSAVLVGVGRWVDATFGAVSVDQVLMNFAGAGEIGGGGEDLVKDGVISAILFPLLVVAILFILWLMVHRRRRIEGRASFRFIPATATLVSVGLFVGGAHFFAEKVGLIRFVASATTDLDIGNYYVDPEVIGEDQPLDLVLIYLESVEDLLADDTVFEKNMLEPIEVATEGWASVDEYRQYDAGWTIGGIVSSQCGLPLRTAQGIASIGDTNLLEEDLGGYLPNAVCLGDVLKDHGYKNVFVRGASSEFASMGAFLLTHGYDKVIDFEELERLGETELRDDWGYSDRVVLSHAKEQLAQLKESGERFNLSILTMDTHEPVRPFDYCDVDTETTMTSVYYCSMGLVAEFLQFVEDEGYMDDTLVVLIGDHLKFRAEGANYYDELGQAENRSIFNRMKSPRPIAFARQRIDQFSMYPTLLELTGFELENHQAGLGLSALTSRVPEGSTQTLGEDEFTELAESRSSAFYKHLWDGTSPSQ